MLGSITGHARSGEIGVDNTSFSASLSGTSLFAEKLGTAFAMVRSDVGGNIDRLEARRATDPQKFGLLFAIVLAEVEAGQQDCSTSAAKGLLWLKRCISRRCMRCYSGT